MPNVKMGTKDIKLPILVESSHLIRNDTGNSQLDIKVYKKRLCITKDCKHFGGGVVFKFRRI